METSQLLTIDTLPEPGIPQPSNPNAVLSLLNSQRYQLWQLGVLALSGAEQAILRSAQALEV